MTKWQRSLRTGLGLLVGNIKEDSYDSSKIKEKTREIRY